MDKVGLSPESCLKRPYTRMIIPDEQSGTFTAKIAEFPGCIAQGDSAQEAYVNLEEAARAWIEAALDLGQEIPSPGIDHEYSGKFALRLPKGLHRQAALAAEREGISLNQFIIYAVSEKMGASNLYDVLAQRLMERIEIQQTFLVTSFNTTFLKSEDYFIDVQASTASTVNIGSFPGIQTGPSSTVLLEENMPRRIQ